MEAVSSVILYDFFIFGAIQAKEKGVTHCLDCPTKEVAVTTFSQKKSPVKTELRAASPTDQFNIDACLVEYWVYLFGLEPGSVQFNDKKEEFIALKNALRNIVQCETSEELKRVKGLLKLISDKVSASATLNIENQETANHQRDFNLLFPFLVKAQFLEPLLKRSKTSDGTEINSKTSDDIEINDNVKKIKDSWKRIPDYKVVKKQFAVMREKYHKQSMNLMVRHIDYIGFVKKDLNCNFGRVPDKVAEKKQAELEESSRMTSLLAKYQRDPKRTATFETLKLIAQQADFSDPFPKKIVPKTISLFDQHLSIGLFFAAVIIGRIAFNSIGLKV